MPWRSALVLVVLLAAPAAAQPPLDDFLRPCRRGDLLGAWQVMRFGFAAGTTVDRSNPTYAIHQHYVFRSDATMVYSASREPLSPEAQRDLPKLTMPLNWALDAQGRLMIQRDGEARVQRSECKVFTQTVTDPRSSAPMHPGDVVLTELGDAERPVARRLLRKPGRPR